MWDEAAAHLGETLHTFEVQVVHPAGWPTLYNASHDRVVFLCTCGLRLNAPKWALPPEMMHTTKSGLKEALLKRAGVTSYSHILGSDPDPKRHDLLGKWSALSRDHAARAHRKVGKLIVQRKEGGLVHRCSCGWTNMLYREQFTSPEEWTHVERTARENLARLTKEAAEERGLLDRGHAPLLAWMDDESVQPR